MNVKKYKIVTFGCQMNLADSGLLASLMDGAGFLAAASEKEADIVILNTCSVREKAESRVMGRLSELGRLKKMDKNKKIAVVGCMAQRLGGQILDKAPYVDIILGTDRLFDLPRFLGNGTGAPLVQTEFGYDNPDEIMPIRDSRYSAFVTISRGCDNFCAYCIVPYVRGRERSYSVSEIICQVQNLAGDGVLEVTLLGQNVNSYKDENHDFTGLLKKVAGDTDIKRVRFMTSHPKDMSERLIEIMGTEPKMMPHVHLPLQAGSNRILKLMGRGYTIEHYMSLVEKLRQACPDISMTTDLIVGFPSETEDEYQLTLSAVRDIRFDSAFMFRYSTRPGTAASRMIDDIPESEKIRRLNALIELQKNVAHEKNQHEIGKIRSVLIDDHSRRDSHILKGKTGGNKTVLINSGEQMIGTIQNVKITSADSWTLHGEIIA